MELTGKCLEEFNKWKEYKGIEKFNSRDYALDTAKTIYNAILIQFFDYLRINILLDKNSNDWWFTIYHYQECSELGLKKYVQKDESTCRIQCLKLAIKKANEIYNQM